LITAPAVKHGIIVDTDINSYNLDLEWAMATRFQGDKGLIVIPKSYASRLDSSSDLEHKLGCKLGFDPHARQGSIEETSRKIESLSLNVSSDNNCNHALRVISNKPSLG
jgi:3-polyprenyl-4-hydroxybenzoate decarboxylase